MPSHRTFHHLTDHFFRFDALLHSLGEMDTKKPPHRWLHLRNERHHARVSTTIYMPFAANLPQSAQKNSWHLVLGKIPILCIVEKDYEVLRP